MKRSLETKDENVIIDIEKVPKFSFCNIFLFSNSYPLWKEDSGNQKWRLYLIRAIPKSTESKHSSFSSQLKDENIYFQAAPFVIFILRTSSLEDVLSAFHPRPATPMLSLCEQAILQQHAKSSFGFFHIVASSSILLSNKED